MNFIKKNSIEFISLVVFLVLLIGGGLFFLTMWNQGTGTKYGSRLEGINKIKISESDLNKIEKKIKENENVTKVSSNIKGRIINFVITFNTGFDINAAKSHANVILDDNFSKDEFEFYDIQVFLLEKDSAEGTKFPVIGYKRKSGNEFVWSNNK